MSRIVCFEVTILVDETERNHAVKNLLIAAAMTLPLLASASDDPRQLIDMPTEARTAMRAEMLDFQTALHLIVSALGEQNLAEAADVAEKQMGISAMGRHRSSPANARPGMFMPREMNAIARGMHSSASEFAKVARGGDTIKALVAMQTVTGACVACHRSFRTQ